MSIIFRGLLTESTLKWGELEYVLEERLLRRSPNTMILLKRTGGCREMWARAGLGMASVKTVLISGIRYN